MPPFHPGRSIRCSLPSLRTCLATWITRTWSMSLLTAKRRTSPGSELGLALQDHLSLGHTGVPFPLPPGEACAWEFGTGMASTLNGLLARGNPAAGVSSAWACVMCLCLAGAHGPFQTLLILASQTCTSPSCVLRSLCLAASHSQSQTSLFHTGLCPSHLVPQPRASTELRFTLGSRELSASASLPHSSPASHLPGPALGHGAGLAPLAVGRALGCVTGMPPCGRAADPTLAAGAVSSG